MKLNEKIFDNLSKIEKEIKKVKKQIIKKENNVLFRDIYIAEIALKDLQAALQNLEERVID